MKTVLCNTMNRAYRMDETEAVEHLLTCLDFSSDFHQKVTRLSEKLVTSVRSHQTERTAIEEFMLHYDLSTEEGILLMCLAEALLRVPDKETERLLIRDKLSSASWSEHLGNSESTFVNMATWGLALSGKILRKKTPGSGRITSLWNGLLRRSGEPVVRQAVRKAMKILSEQFVIGRNIKEALEKSKGLVDAGYCFSYDMLGEVARTQQDADRYYQSYFEAITELGQANSGSDLIHGPSISVKLSALHPRYEYSQREVVVPYLIKRVKNLVTHAKNNHLSLTIDAEEADRLEMSMEIIQAIFCDDDFKGWEGLGLALQAYQKRAFHFIDWLIELSRSTGKRIQVRLVKGAYWDTEVKLSQVEGFENYPVFTRKVNTDLSYLACAKKMLSAQDAIYPQFATHNAYSVAAILSMMDGEYHRYRFEFQNLQGMGKTLHDEIVGKNHLNLPCRIYAPVGSHEDLLPYLVRRLLENGANSSFVNRIADPSVPIQALVESPVERIRQFPTIPNHKIPLPRDIYGVSRANSSGLDLSDRAEQDRIEKAFAKAQQAAWVATPMGRVLKAGENVTNPCALQTVVGQVEQASVEDVSIAMQQAVVAQVLWDECPVLERAAVLRKMADLLEQEHETLMYLAVREAGKTIPDAIAEVREAVDFCRYYAAQAEQTLIDDILPGPTGETNILRMNGRGVILCISPWNFPLAIFAGQVAAALVTGNAVVAKPAEQTPLIAAFAVSLFHQAGVPASALQLLPGAGEVIGAALVEHPDIAGVMFTGSNETARAIQLALAKRPGAILPLIAETGGINAMIADSTALPEQLVNDVMMSAFGSAGQRCSALRLLLVQEDIADGVLTMLAGAMAELTVGDPVHLDTDVGPVIDGDAKQMLESHIDTLHREATLIYGVKLPESVQSGTFVAPHAFELPSIKVLKREVFGPVLHVVRYRSEDLDTVIDQVNDLGYGLTFGIQSRIDEVVEHIQSRIKVGNIYVNRNMVGAVVGVQPFGGSRLSGTGPKAGGPHYLMRLCTESTLTIDTTAAGGNASLMAMEN